MVMQGKEEGVELSLEFMAKDGAWYAGSVSMTGPSMKNMQVHFLHYDEDEDEIWYPQSFRSCDDVNAMIRPVSEPMEDSDCGKLRRGMILCVACRRPDSDCFEYYDARLERLDRSKHRGQDICRCRFEVEWLGGPLRGQRQFVPCADICLLKPGDIEDDPVVKEFIKHVRDALQASNKRLCTTKSTSPKGLNSSVCVNSMESLPALVETSKPSSKSELNQNMALVAHVGEEERNSKIAEEHNDIINLDSDDEIVKDDTMAPDNANLKGTSHNQDWNDVQSDPAGKQIDDAFPDRSLEANTCMQNGPSVLSKENVKIFDKSQVLLVENLEMDLSPSITLQTLSEVSPGALMVFIWPHLEYEITKKAYIFYRDPEAAETAFSSFHSDKFMVISSKGRPWVVSRAELCSFDWDRLCSVGDMTVAMKEQEANKGGNQSAETPKLSLLPKGAEKYASAVARYKLFLAQKKKISTYNQMFQEEERMLEEALSC